MARQVTVRHGPALHVRLDTALASCPPSAWLPVVPQLLAQLPAPPAESRLLLLRRLQAAASVSPFAVLYPCMVEASAAGAADRQVVPEVQVRGA